MKKNSLWKAVILSFFTVAIIALSFSTSTGYNYNGKKWNDAIAASGVGYYSNAADMPGSISESDFIGAFQAGQAKWTDVPSSYFTFAYFGTTSAGNDRDGINTVLWVDESSLRDTSTLAVNTTWSYVSTGEIFESDIRINNTKNWMWAQDTNLNDNTFDLQSVLTHELGHTLHLGDLYDSDHSSSMMYGYYKAHRDLAQDDIDGITYIYPVDGPTPTPSPGTGSPQPSPTDTDTGGGSSSGFSGGGGCFIATAAYGSYMNKDVMVLREFRDNVLLKSTLGRLFVDMYYKSSPPIANFIAGRPALMAATRLALAPVVFMVKFPVPAFLIIFAAILVILSVVKMCKAARTDN